MSEWYRDRLRIIACSVLFFSAAGGVLADEWDAFVPPPDKAFDWIQLTSGEWLKGDLKAMYNYTVEFDSDEMDLQEFDLDDVQRLRTRNSQTILIETGWRQTEILTGTLEMNGKSVVLRDGGEERQLKRRQLISIAERAERESDRWSGMFSLGANMRRGNTHTADMTVMANLKRRSAVSRFNTDYLANYSEADNDRTADNQRLTLFFDRFLTSRFYWKVVSFEYYRDPFSNIEGQYSLGTGIGYDLIRSSRTEWTVNGSVGYQEQKFSSVAAGEDNQSGSPYGALGTRFDFEVSDDLDLLYDYSMRVLNEDNGQYTHHMLGQLSFDLYKDLDLDISLIWDYIESPQEASDGTTPDNSDYQLVVSVAYDF